MRGHRVADAFWSVHSRTWDDALADAAVVEHVDAVVGLLAGALPPPVGGVVVDLGCGTGNHAAALAALLGPGVAVAGVDRNGAMLRRAAAKGGGAALVRADLGDPLPFRAGSVAGALSVYAAQFLDLPAFLGEVGQVVRPGAPLVLEVPRPSSHRRDLAGLSVRYRAFQRVKRVAAATGARAGMVRTIEPDDLAAALGATGYEVAELRVTPHSTVVLARAAWAQRDSNP